MERARLFQKIELQRTQCSGLEIPGERAGPQSAEEVGVGNESEENREADYAYGTFAKERKAMIICSRKLCQEVGSVTGS